MMEFTVNKLLTSGNLKCLLSLLSYHLPWRSSLTTSHSDVRIHLMTEDSLKVVRVCERLCVVDNTSESWEINLLKWFIFLLSTGCPLVVCQLNPSDFFNSTPHVPYTFWIMFCLHRTAWIVIIAFVCFFRNPCCRVPTYTQSSSTEKHPVCVWGDH